MNQAPSELNPSPRILLGPGPSTVHPRVLRAMSTPLLGYLDPEFVVMLGETQDMLRQVFQTQNALTLPVSGTGMAGMETVLANLLEPGDQLLVCAAGYFGNRLEEVALRHGAQVTRIEKPWGEVYTPEEVEAALRAHPAKVLAIVHAETSTGALQPLEGLGEIAHRHGALLLVDCVTSLGGVPIKLDEWGIDAAYSGTQKCLGCPPGLSPVSVSEQAREVIRSRRTSPPAGISILSCSTNIGGRTTPTITPCPAPWSMRCAKVCGWWPRKGWRPAMPATPPTPTIFAAAWPSWT